MLSIDDIHDILRIPLIGVVPESPSVLDASVLQRELQLVVAKYVNVPPREVSVRIGHPRHAPQGLEVRIELPQPAQA